MPILKFIEHSSNFETIISRQSSLSRPLIKIDCPTLEQCFDGIAEYFSDQEWSSLSRLRYLSEAPKRPEEIRATYSSELARDPAL